MSPLKQAILCAVLVGVAAGGWFLYSSPQAIGLRGSDAGNASGQQPRAPGAGPGENRIPGLIGGGGAVNVIVAPVEVDRGGDTVVALGTAAAAQSVVLYPQVSGIVSGIRFSPAQKVEKGAVLLTLDDDEEQVAADRARIEYAQARAAFERSQSLAESNTISSVALADAEMAAQLAENGVRTAEIAAQRRQIVAPFAGIVGLTDISVGDFVTSTTPIATLDDLSTVRVRFELPERWAARIVAGQAITASAQGVPGSKITGQIIGIDNRVDATTRTLALEAELTNPDGMLKAGMAINVTLLFDSVEELAVPSLSVQWDRSGSFVWKVVDGAARRAEIAVVKRESGVVIVSGELADGDQVVVEGTQRLREGAMLTIVDETPRTVGDEAPAAAEAEEPAVSSGAVPGIRS